MIENHNKLSLLLFFLFTFCFYDLFQFIKILIICDITTNYYSIITICN